MIYYVYYNGKYIAMYKNLTSARDFIKRKGLRNDEDNLLQILDNQWNEYEL